MCGLRDDISKPRENLANIWRFARVHAWPWVGVSVGLGLELAAVHGRRWDYLGK